MYTVYTSAQKAAREAYAVYGRITGELLTGRHFTGYESPGAQLTIGDQSLFCSLACNENAGPENTGRGT